MMTTTTITNPSAVKYDVKLRSSSDDLELTTVGMTVSTGENSGGGGGGGGGGDEASLAYFDPRFPKSISIFLLVVGVFGNSLCLYIFSRKNMRKNSTFIYLAFLACVDLFVLSLGLSDIVFIAYLNFVLRNQALVICRVVSFLIYLFTHLSSFILASVSIDRAIATNFITFSKTYCRPHTAYKVIAFNIFLAVLINFHNLFFMGHTTKTTRTAASGGGDENGLSIDYVSSSNRSSSSSKSSFSSSSSSSDSDIVVQVICESKKDTVYDAFIDPYFKWIDLLAYAIIPFIIMLICTFLIVRVLFRSNRRLNKNRALTHQSTTTTQSHQNKESNESMMKKESATVAGSASLLTTSPSTALLNSNKDQNATTNTTTTTTNNKNSSLKMKSASSAAAKSVMSNTPSAVAANRASKAKHLTYTLIILNCLFFCLVGPLLIVLVTMSDQMINDQKILLNIVYLLAYANHTFNFVLYGFSSPPFRNELFRILGIRSSGSAAPAAANQPNENRMMMTTTSKRK